MHAHQDDMCMCTIIPNTVEREDLARKIFGDLLTKSVWQENIWRFTAKKHHLTNHVHNFGGFYFCGIKTKQPISHKTGKFDNLAIWRLILI